MSTITVKLQFQFAIVFLLTTLALMIVSAITAIDLSSVISIMGALMGGSAAARGFARTNGRVFNKKEYWRLLGISTCLMYCMLLALTLIELRIHSSMEITPIVLVVPLFLIAFQVPVLAVVYSDRAVKKYLPKA